MRKKMSAFIVLLVLFSLLFSVKALASTGSAADFSVEVVCNCWSKNTSSGGSTLYTPYLKLNITNQQKSSVSSVIVKAVFYEEANKSLWSDETDYLVSYSDDPLKSGYKKTSFIRSSVGYYSQKSAGSLPTITADIYINDVYYGSIEIRNSYSETSVSQKLTKSSTQSSSSKASFATNDPFGVKVTAAYWFANTGYTGQTLYVPYLKIEVTNQQSKAASDIKVKVIFIDTEENSIWDDETYYLISYGDTPLKVGYNKTAYIRAGVGYKKQISVNSLPNITAEVYINDEFYGTVNVDKTYSANTPNTVLKKTNASEKENSVKVDTENPYLVTVTTNCWTANKSSWGGSTLYVPYLKLNVMNQSGKNMEKAVIKAVFYNEEEKELWSDEEYYLISSSDTPVQHGLSKTAYIKSSVGYSSKLSESKLPNLTAEIYLNDEYIGLIKIKNTYSESVISETINKTDSQQEAANIKAGDEPYEVYVTTNCWAANSGTTTLYTPYLKLKVINQQGKPAQKINMQIVFYDEAEKTIWSDETYYLISSSDTPLKNGYGKTAYIRSSVGYKSKISDTSLPNISAEIYINDELYGSVKVKNTYTSSVISEKLERKATKSESNGDVKNTDGKEYTISYLSNCWTDSTGSNGETLYVPYLKVNVTNQQSSSKDKVVVKVVFVEESDKKVWSDETYYLVSGSDTPLRSGYSKTAYVKASVGYRSKIDVDQLPKITASVYINDVLYDTVAINNQYGN